MAVRPIAIEEVLNARHLMIRDGEGNLQTTVLQTLPSGETAEVDFSPVRMEVYTGWVGVGFSVFGSLFRADVITFLPTSGRNLRTYADNTLLHSTVTASPATIQPVEGEAALFGIDGVKSVALESQHFDATDPDHEDFCL